MSIGIAKVKCVSASWIHSSLRTFLVSFSLLGLVVAILYNTANHFFKFATGTVLHLQKLAGFPDGGLFSPDGRCLETGSLVS